MSLSPPKARCILEDISADSDFGQVKTRALALYRLTEGVCTRLTPVSGRITRVANFTDGLLSIETGTKSAMLEIISRRTVLTDFLRKQFIPELKDIAVRVNPEINTVPVKGKARVISGESAEMLELIAGISPAGLRDALMRLTRHRKN